MDKEYKVMANKGKIAALAVMVCAIVVFAVSGKEPGSDDTASGNAADAATETGGSFSIPVNKITTTAGFFPVELDGTAMEIIAVRDSDGNIRTAFDTCQSCYSSGRGYYEQNGDYLVCQNCGTRFTMDQIGIDASGCNPWPIFEEDRTVTDEEILISYDFLNKSKDIFANWKVDY